MPRPRPLLLAALALCAHAPVAAGDDAIPFDVKKAKALADRDRAWLEAATRAAYRKVGRPSPKWDADVEAAFRANLDRVHGQVWGRPVATADWRRGPPPGSSASAHRRAPPGTMSLPPTGYPQVGGSWARTGAEAHGLTTPSRTRPPPAAGRRTGRRGAAR
jgi:hypothetical protein